MVLAPHTHTHARALVGNASVIQSWGARTAAAARKRARSSTDHWTKNSRAVMVEQEHATTCVCVCKRERAIGLERVNPIMRSYHPLTHRNSIKVRKSFPDWVVSFKGFHTMGWTFSW
jgi:hypothetical protein